MNHLQNLTNPQPAREDDGGSFLKKMTKLRLGMFALISLALVGGGVYLISTAFSDVSEPPTLELNTVSMGQGMARTSVKQVPGFAKFTQADKDAYKCNPKFEVNLGARITHLFPKQKVTLKEIASAIHPTPGSQYLIAFYEPANGEVNREKNTYYLYPTDSSPFKSNPSIDVVGTLDGEFEVPAYRGFQIITDDPEALFCKASLFKTATDGIWYTKDGKEISFELTAKILKSMRVLPKGWVMLPAGNNTAIIGGFFDLFGKDAIDTAYYMADTGEFKEFNYDKDWNSKTETGTKLAYNAVWFHLNKKVNVSFIIDDILALMEKQSGGAKKTSKSGTSTVEVKDTDVEEAAKVNEDVKVEGGDKVEGTDDVVTEGEDKVEGTDDVVTEGGDKVEGTDDVVTEGEDKVEGTDDDVVTEGGDVNCEVDSSDPICNPIDSGEEDTIDDGNNKKMMTDQVGFSVEVEGVYLFNVNELAVCFNYSFGDIPEGTKPSDIFTVSNQYIGNIELWDLDQNRYSGCDNDLDVLIDTSVLINNGEYVLTIPTLDNYTYTFVLDNVENLAIESVEVTSEDRDFIKVNFNTSISDSGLKFDGVYLNDTATGKHDERFEVYSLRTVSDTSVLISTTTTNRLKDGSSYYISFDRNMTNVLGYGFGLNDNAYILNK